MFKYHKNLNNFMSSLDNVVVEDDYPIFDSNRPENLNNLDLVPEGVFTSEFSSFDDLLTDKSPELLGEKSPRIVMEDVDQNQILYPTDESLKKCMPAEKNMEKGDEYSVCGNFEVEQKAKVEASGLGSVFDKNQKLSNEDSDESYEVTSNIPTKPKRKRQEKGRWGRKNDKDMFTKLLELLKPLGICQNTFYCASMEQKASKYKILMELLIEGISWKGTKEHLIKRIHTLASVQTFSVREMKTLRKLVRESENQIDYTTIQLSFPGKTLQTIRNTINKNCKDLICYTKLSN